MAEMKEGQYMEISVSAKTKRGHKAGIEENSATFESSDETIAYVEVNKHNEMKAKIHAIAVGSALITFRADGKRGVGEKLIVGLLPIVVTEGDAVVFDISAGEAIDEAEEDTDATHPDPVEPIPSEPILWNRANQSSRCLNQWELRRVNRIRANRCLMNRCPMNQHRVSR